MNTKSSIGLSLSDRQGYSYRTAPARKVRVKAKSGFSLSTLLIRVMDIILSSMLILFLLPVFLTVSVLIYMNDRGSVFFVQKRVGKNGEDFHCFKFRSMRSDADEIFQRYLESHPVEAANWQAYRKLDRDPRITPIGRFIRKTSLDEFPQLINVLRGEMSLVGPRPIMRDEVTKYGPSFRVYTSLLPGITGLWQVMGRNNLTYRQRVSLDRLFSRKTSMVMYLVILFMTVPAVLFQRGSK